MKGRCECNECQRCRRIDRGRFEQDNVSSARAVPGQAIALGDSRDVASGRVGAGGVLASIRTGSSRLTSLFLQESRRAMDQERELPMVGRAVLRRP